MSKYKKNFLTQVIFQVNFAPIELLKSPLNYEFSTRCRSLTSVECTQNSNTHIDLNNGKVLSQIYPIHSFIGEDIHVNATYNYLQIIFFKYKTHEDSHPIINDLTESFIKVYKPIFERVAIRYINIIKFPDGDTYDFENFINKSLLLSTIEYKKLGLCRSVGNMFIKDEDEDLLVNFVYGFANSEFPNRISKREFILDFDCYKITDDKNILISQTLESIRNSVNKIFEQSIGNNLRNEMNN